MELTGSVKLIGEVATFGDKGFRKRDLVITTEEQYPQHILVEFVQDKCDLLDAFEIGDGVTIGINIRGREWTNQEGVVKYFNSIQGWKIAKSEAPTAPTLEAPAPEQTEDLPF